MREILADLTATLDQGRSCVYCSVIETRGSTPQKAGASMIVFPDGSQRGTLGSALCHRRSREYRWGSGLRHWPSRSAGGSGERWSAVRLLVGVVADR